MTIYEQAQRIAAEHLAVIKDVKPTLDDLAEAVDNNFQCENDWTRARLNLLATRVDLDSLADRLSRLAVRVEDMACQIHPGIPMVAAILAIILAVVALLP